jgi:hypothetical protein
MRLSLSYLAVKLYPWLGMYAHSSKRSLPLQEQLQPECEPQLLPEQKRQPQVPLLFVECVWRLTQSDLTLIVLLQGCLVAIAALSLLPCSVLRRG